MGRSYVAGGQEDRVEPDQVSMQSDSGPAIDWAPSARNKAGLGFRGTPKP